MFYYFYYKKDEIGLIEVIPETIDDLWHLSHIVEEGDYVSTLTTRRIQDKTSGKTRADRGVKKTFFLGIRVEKINFHKYTGMLRFTGIIESGPEDLVPLGSHHTINVQINNSIKIQKTWNKWSLERLNTAVKASKRPTEIIVAMEDNTTDLGIIKELNDTKVMELLVYTKPSNLQKRVNKNLNLYEQEIERPKVINEIINS